MLKTISVRTSRRMETVDITELIQEEVSRSGIDEGICICYVPHTTAGIIINEGADPAVCEDILDKLEQVIPRRGSYKHLEGNADSHIKSAIVGSSVTVIIERGRLLLGTWQKIFFCEFDGPRTRKVYVKLIKG